MNQLGNGLILQQITKESKDLQPGLASSHFFFRRRQVLPRRKSATPLAPLMDDKHTASFTPPM